MHASMLSQNDICMKTLKLPRIILFFYKVDQKDFSSKSLALKYLLGITLTETLTQVPSVEIPLTAPLLQNLAPDQHYYCRLYI